MSQNPLTIADGTGAAVLAEINAALDTLASCSSGASAPANPVAGMLWADTGAGVMKQRNEANNGWNTLFSLSASLGSAAALNAGTAAGNLVQLVASGKLPALDGSQLTGISSSSEQSLTGFYAPTMDGGYRDMYRSGFLPAWFNPQWGGSQWGNLPDGSFGSVATGNVQDDTIVSPGINTNYYYVAAGFKVPETAPYDAALVKLYKTGNPAGNITARIYSDNGSGVPNAAIGSSATLSCKMVTAKSDGEWYQISGLAAALTANTQYHLVLQVTVDGSNYINWKSTASKKYPHGTIYSGTSAPSWTVVTGYVACFQIQNPSANALIQAGGMFDAKLCFNQGSPVDQSRAVFQPLVNFYDGKNCTMLYRGTYAASSNVLDLAYGIDHDRITLTVNSSGYPVLTIYRSDRTAYTITGTGSVTSGNHDVGFRIRTVGDGADYATLYVDGVSVGTPLTAQTFTMDKALRDLGTMRLGDGFGLAPTWTQDMPMTSLPSAQGWTKGGTGTEANCFSVQGGKLYQNATGFASTDTCYYSKTTAFSNTTGWAVTWKCRVAKPAGIASIGSSGAIEMAVQDGTKQIIVTISDYYLGTAGATVQGDFASQENVFTLQGKGSDYYLFCNGRLLIDGTGGLTASSAGSNSIFFGDASATAGENADAIWSYVKYYQGGMILPVANSGTCSEFAHWSGDRSALLPTLYNSGTPKSVKEVCGVPRNYQYEQVVQREVRRGVTSSPTTTSTAPTICPELECYVIGEDISLRSQAVLSNADTSANFLTASVDGVVNTQDSAGFNNTGTYWSPRTINSVVKRPVGLRKVEVRWYVSGNTATAQLTYRNAVVEARS